MVEDLPPQTSRHAPAARFSFTRQVLFAALAPIIISLAPILARLPLHMAEDTIALTSLGTTTERDFLEISFRYSKGSTVHVMFSDCFEVTLAQCECVRRVAEC